MLVSRCRYLGGQDAGHSPHAGHQFRPSFGLDPARLSARLIGRICKQYEDCTPRIIHVDRLKPVRRTKGVAYLPGQLPAGFFLRTKHFLRLLRP